MSVCRSHMAASLVSERVRAFGTACARGDNIYDCVIAGGGVIGSSTADHLASVAPEMRIAVVERDPTYTYASAPLSAGGIRQQFSMRENILMSLYGVQFLKVRTQPQHPPPCSWVTQCELTSLYPQEAAERLAVEGLGEPPAVQFHEGGYLFMASTVPPHFHMC